MGKRVPRCKSPGCTYAAVVDQPVCVRHGGVYPTRATVTPIDHMALCGATRRDGGSCTQPRMRGATVCRIHGGSHLRPWRQRRTE